MFINVRFNVLVDKRSLIIRPHFVMMKCPIRRSPMVRNNGSDAVERLEPMSFSAVFLNLRGHRVIVQVCQHTTRISAYV